VKRDPAKTPATSPLSNEGELLTSTIGGSQRVAPHVRNAQVGRVVYLILSPPKDATLGLGNDVVNRLGLRVAMLE
jgi:hypothetical protein